MHALAGEDDTLSSVLSALPPMAGSVRLLDILEGTPIPTFVIDCNHRVTHWNRACEAIIGISAAEIVGTDRQWQAFYPEPRPVMADLIVDGITDEMVARLYAGRWRQSPLIPGGYEAEGYFEHFPGGGRWLSFTAAPLYDADGTLLGAIETLQDISANKEAELRQREHAAERTLAQIVQNSPVPTFVIDADHRIIHWNRACERVIGRTAESLVGTRLQWQAFYERERPVLADLVLDGAPEAEICRYYPRSVQRSTTIEEIGRAHV